MRVRTTLFGALLVLWGCEMTVDVDLDAPPAELVVIGYFTPGEPWHVILQRTVRTGEEVPDVPVFIEQARVTITDNGGEVIELVHTGGGFYYHAAEPLEGHCYTLHAQAEGLPSVEASDCVPARVAVLRESLQNTPDGEEVLRLDVQDPDGERNYYELLLLSNSYPGRVSFTLLNPELAGQLRALTGEDVFEPDLSSPSVDRALLHDEPFDGSIIDLHLESHGLQGATAYVRAVSKAYYDYARTSYLQRTIEGNPFVEPLTIQSNVQGGLGIFAAYTTHAIGEQTPAHLRNMAAGTYTLYSLEAEHNDQPLDLMAGGASATLRLSRDGSVEGTLTLPSEEDGRLQTVSLEGGFTIHEAGLQLYHSAPTMLRDMTFRIEPDALSAAIGGGRSWVRVQFVKQPGL